MSIFRNGQEVLSIWWDDGSSINVGDAVGCERITVIMEDGHMNGIPWFAVWEKGEIVSTHNSTYIASVILKKGGLT